MKHIILCGEWYSKNFGDPILCKCTEKLILENSKEEIKIHILDLTYGHKNLILLHKIINRLTKIFINHQAYNKFTSLRRAFLCHIFLKFLLLRYSIDKIIFAGGQLFLDYFTTAINDIVNESNKKHIPVYFNACGVGKNSEEEQKKIEHYLRLNNVKYISVRDGATYFKTIDIHQTYDSAIFTNHFFDISNHKKSPKTEFGLGVICYETYCKSAKDKLTKKEYFTYWNNLIDILIKNRINWKIFTNGSEDDFFFAKELLYRNNIIDEKMIIHPNSKEDLIYKICSFNKIFSCRLHSLIIAYSYNIPTGGIIWDNKVLAFEEFIGNQDNFLYLNAPNLKESIINFIKNEQKEPYNNILKEKIKIRIIENIKKIIL